MLLQSDISCDPWLAEQLGCDVYRFSEDALMNVDEGASPSDFAPGCPELRRGRVFAYARLPVTASGHLNRLLALGFTVAEVSVTLRRAGRPAPVVMPADVVVRAAGDDDESAVTELARRAFENSRFHTDSLITQSQADDLKANWAANFFAGKRGDTMSLAEVDGVCAGFLLAIHDEPNVLIDLVAVDATFRGRGIARHLADHALSQSTATAMQVGTQLDNHAALHCYLRAGFSIDHSEYVLHWHHRPGSQPE